MLDHTVRAARAAAKLGLRHALDRDDDRGGLRVEQHSDMPGLALRITADELAVTTLEGVPSI